MPFYTFKCPKCNYEKEVMQKMDDEPPNCKFCTKMVPRNFVEMERVWKSNARPRFKGAGFYDTEYKNLAKISKKPK